MDYTQQSIRFKLKKAVRYCLLYGVDRTLVKVKGQYHMKKVYQRLPKIAQQRTQTGHVGLIGCGNYAFSNIAYYLNKQHKGAIRAAMDSDINKAASMFENYKLAYYTTDIDELLNDAHIDLIYIASNHASHAEYAIKALQMGKHVHIEKPHAVTFDQLQRLIAAAEDSPAKIVSVGYNRPTSDFGERIKKSLWSEQGAGMYNWFVAGHELDPEHWYFKSEEGGRVLGNLCHWTDFTYTMIAAECRYPITISPVRADQSDCDIAVNYIFGDGSIAVITFSAKGHTFEGVREKFAAHRGNVLISMDDFQRLTIETVDKKNQYKKLSRDHGHQNAILSSYHRAQTDQGLAHEYIWQTAELFLKTKEALESNQTLVIEGGEC
tara:strand:- start:174 stop:1307 length:1134 start_codon:yes stop_codon:yes gene_type:complete